MVTSPTTITMPGPYSGKSNKDCGDVFPKKWNDGSPSSSAGSVTSSSTTCEEDDTTTSSSSTCSNLRVAEAAQCKGDTSAISSSNSNSNNIGSSDRSDDTKGYCHQREDDETIDDYQSRRNRRLEALKSGRLERRKQLQQSLSSEVGSSTLLCVEDHPYYLAQQERKLHALKKRNINSSGNLQEKCRGGNPLQGESKRQIMKVDVSAFSSPPLGEEASSDDISRIAEAMREELLAAYQLIHRQRIRIQQLEKQQQQQQQRNLGEQQGMIIPLEKQGDNNNNKNGNKDALLVRELQNQLVQLHHDKAQEVFYLQNRITHDTMKSEERVSFFQTKADYWQIRSQNGAEIHEIEMTSAKERIQELEETVSLLSRAKTTTGKVKDDHDANESSSLEEEEKEESDAESGAKNNNSKSKNHEEVTTLSSSLSSSKLASAWCPQNMVMSDHDEIRPDYGSDIRGTVSLSLEQEHTAPPLSDANQNPFQQQTETAAPHRPSQADLILGVMNKKKSKPRPERRNSLFQKLRSDSISRFYTTTTKKGSS